jgi:hypothetical protein
VPTEHAIGVELADVTRHDRQIALQELANGRSPTKQMPVESFLA